MKLRSQSGSALPLILVAIAMVGLFAASTLDLVVFARQQVAIGRNLVTYQNALDSMVDYTIYAVRNRWCMTPLWDSDISCTMTHDHNLERLLLTDLAVRSLNDNHWVTNGVGSVPPQFRKMAISRTVPIASLASTHPLYNAITAIRNQADISDLRFTVSRIDNKRSPRWGNETELKIEVELIGSAVLLKSLSTIKAEATVLAFPRELSMFSLVVPKDMRLDQSSASSAIGDANIALQGGPSGGGLRFESPPFVNGDIHLPPTGGGFANVKFVARPVVGGGQLKRNGAPYALSSLGDASNRFYDSFPEFGGFLSGVEFDGVSDKGGPKFIDAAPAGVTVNMDQCIRFTKIKTDLKDTANSQLVVARNALPVSGATKIGFRLGWTESNMFLEQSTFGRKTVGAGSGAVGPDVVPPPAFNPELVPLLGGTVLPKAVMHVAVESAGAFRSGSYIGRELKMKTLFNSGAIIVVSGRQVVFPGGDPTKPQPHLMDIEIEAPAGFAGLPPTFEVDLVPFDVGFHDGYYRRKIVAHPGGTINTEGTGLSKRRIKVVVETAGGVLSIPTLLALAPPGGMTDWRFADTLAAVPAAQAPIDGTDWGDSMATCMKERSKVSQALAPADFGGDFSAHTRISWNFARPTTLGGAPRYSYTSPPGDAETTIVFTNANESTFHIHGIKQRCVIAPSATFAAGFLACDELEIQPRGQPLTIVGTIIAGRTVIDPSAINAGIAWRSIYHPQSLIELRQKGVLKQFNGTPCPEIPDPNEPVWSNVLSITAKVSQYQCSSLFLRQQAQPFQWTAIDPDCGLDASQQMACKRRPLKFLMHELSRKSDL